MATSRHKRRFFAPGLVAALLLALGARALAAPVAVTDVAMRSTQSSLAFLRVALPKGRLYVGQSVPIAIKAYFRPGMEVRLSGPPNLGMQAFTISQLSEEPRQSVETIGGVPYRVAAWTGLVSAAMPGNFTTAATLPVVLRYREAAQPQDDPFASFFDDDDMMPSSRLLRSLMNRSLLSGGFDDLFGRVQEREMTLAAAERSIDVLPLPAQGRPSDFSGAVGSFDIQATLDAKSGAAFEPRSLQLAISGRGNFDRVTTAGLPASSSWKSYPPSARFTPSGAAPTLAGVKTFEQAVVPQVSGQVELPAISFSFFDPEQGKYVTRSTVPMTLRIAPAPASAAISAQQGEAASVSESAGGLQPNRQDAGHLVKTLLPPYMHAWFWLGCALPWLAVALALLLRRNARTSAPQGRALRSRLAEQRAAMRQAARAQDAVRFYAAAEQLVQAKLGAAWGVLPEEVTAAAVDLRMGEAGAPLASTLRTAEWMRYAGQPPRPEALGEHGQLLEQKLKQLENRS